MKSNEMNPGQEKDHYETKYKYQPNGGENYRLLKTEKIYFDVLPKKPLILPNELETRRRRTHVRLVPLLTADYVGIQDEKAISSRSNSSVEYPVYRRHQSRKSRSRRNARRRRRHMVAEEVAEAAEDNNGRLHHLRKRNPSFSIIVNGNDNDAAGEGSGGRVNSRSYTYQNGKYSGIKLV